MVAPNLLDRNQTCLDDNVASEFVSGSLPKLAVTKVEKHLATCRDCRELVAALAGDHPELALGDSAVETEPRDHRSAGGSLKPLRTWSIGDRVGRYVVLSILGQGGMGVVFAAYDPQLDRKIALKLLRTNSGINSKDARARLRREAQAIAQLSHPNVVNVYDVGATDDGDVYIAMEFVEGDNLTAWLKKWARSPREIVDVFLQAARGLAAAHAVGLLHRDFKPDNVLVGGDGRVRVTDFGLARSLLGPDESPRPTTGSSHLHAELTATGTVLGTPRYMPPEQILGPDIDARADQFSFCVALYEALYEQHPLPGATAVGMVDRGERAIAPPEKKGVPLELGKALVRGLEKERGKRWMSMSALIAELAPRERRSPMKLIAIGLAAIVVAGAATAAVFALTKDPGPKITMDVDTQHQLLDRLSELEKERKDLLAQLTTVKAGREHDIKVLEQQLKQKSEEVADLAVRVAEITKKLETRGVPVPQAKPVKQPPPQDQRVITALEADEFTGCFAEWSDRTRNLEDATIPVRLTVMADGRTHSAEATFPASISLKLCIEGAIARLKFPPGPEELDVLAEVRYSHEDSSSAISATVVGRRVPSANGVDIKE